MSALIELFERTNRCFGGSRKGVSNIARVTLLGNTGAYFVQTARRDRPTLVFVTCGLAIVSIDGEAQIAGPGSFFCVPPGALYGCLPLYEWLPPTLEQWVLDIDPNTIKLLVVS